MIVLQNVKFLSFLVFTPVTYPEYWIQKQNTRLFAVYFFLFVPRIFLDSVFFKNVQNSLIALQ